MPSTSVAAANALTSSQSRRPMGGASAGRDSRQMERPKEITESAYGSEAHRHIGRKHEI
jgi:hypothetical protein